MNAHKKAYIIKYANGEGNMMTIEHALTEDGKNALAFAKAAGEEGLLRDIDEAFDMFLEMCHKEPASFNA